MKHGKQSFFKNSDLTNQFLGHVKLLIFILIEIVKFVYEKKPLRGFENCKYKNWPLYSYVLVLLKPSLKTSMTIPQSDSAQNW